jgi:NADP-dependent 3-hydroxy acid dehydrogenase YdfG
VTPQERPAVVTGASSGIGEATARGLAAAGHAVVLGARRLDRCEQVAAEITAAGGTAYAFGLDVTDEASRSAFVKQAQEAVGDVDVLVSNAGISRPASVLAADEQQLVEHLQVNLLGAHALTRAFGQGMVDRGRGDLVYVTSETVTTPRPLVAPYMTSKWAVEGLVAALLMELEGTGVRVSCIRPGQTVTEMGLDWDPAVLTEVLESWTSWGLARHPYFLPPEGVAAAVLAVVGAPPGVAFRYLDVAPVPPKKQGS